MKLKKLFALLLALALVLTSFSFAVADGVEEDDYQESVVEVSDEVVEYVVTWKNEKDGTTRTDNLTGEDKIWDKMTKDEQALDPTKDYGDWVFEGWFVGDTALTKDQKPTAATTVVAKFHKKNVSIKIDLNGGKYVDKDGKETKSFDPKTFEYGKAITFKDITGKDLDEKNTLIKDPIDKDGFEFIGFATKADATEAEFAPNFEFGATKDTTLYAIYKKLPGQAKYLIRFLDEDGKTVLWKGYVQVDEIPDKEYKDTPTKAGDAETTWVFDKWNPEIDEDTVVEKAQDYIAVFKKGEAVQYPITFVNYDGEELDKQNLDYNAAVKYKGETPVKPNEGAKGYEFDGWVDANKKEYGPSDTLPAATAAMTYTAKYKEVEAKFTVTFVLDDNADPKKATVYDKVENIKYDATIKTPKKAPQKLYPDDNHYEYEFLGWAKVVDGVPSATEPIAPDTAIPNIAANEYYVAVFSDWTVGVECTITLDFDGGKGWDWDKEEYVDSIKIKARYGEDVEAYIDEGWYRYSAYKDLYDQYIYLFTTFVPSVSHAKVEGDVTYKAQYVQRVKTYDVEFVNENPRFDDIGDEWRWNVEYGKTVEAPKWGPRDGYVLTWKDSNGRVWDDSMPIEGRGQKDGIEWIQGRNPVITFTAVWTYKEYSVTFDANGGTPATINTQNVPAGREIEARDDIRSISKKGQEFLGWKVDGEKEEILLVPGEWSLVIKGKPYPYEGDNGDNNYYGVKKDIKLIAQWGTTHTVSFIVGNTVEDTKKVDDGKKVTKPEDPYKEGYAFDGWYVGTAEGIITGTKPFDFDTPITENLVLVAKFGGYWDSNDAGEDGSIVIEDVAVEYNATKKGYVFTATFYTSDEANVDSALVKIGGDASTANAQKIGNYVQGTGTKQSIVVTEDEIIAELSKKDTKGILEKKIYFFNDSNAMAQTFVFQITLDGGLELTRKVSDKVTLHMTARLVSVEIDPKGGTRKDGKDLEPIKKLDGQTLAESEMPALQKTNGVFLGWVDTDGKDWDFTKALAYGTTGKVNIVARWKAGKWEAPVKTLDPVAAGAKFEYKDNVGELTIVGTEKEPIKIKKDEKGYYISYKLVAPTDVTKADVEGSKYVIKLEDKDFVDLKGVIDAGDYEGRVVVTIKKYIDTDNNFETLRAKLKKKESFVYKYQFKAAKDESSLEKLNVTFVPQYVEFVDNEVTVLKINNWKTTVTLTFDDKPVEVEYGTDYNVVQPKKDGYKFIKWVKLVKNDAGKEVEVDIDPETEWKNVTKEAKYVSKWQLAAVESAFSASFTANLKMNFFYNMPEDLVKDSTAFVTITSEAAKIKDKKAVTGDGKSGEDYYFVEEIPIKFFYAPLAVKVFKGEDQVAVYDKTGAIVGTEDDPYTFVKSLADYADTAIEKGKPSMKKLAKALKYYGYAAAKYFGGTVPQVQPEVPGALTWKDEIKHEGTVPAGITNVSVSVNFRSANRLNVIYTPVAGQSLENYTITLDGKDVTSSVQVVKGEWYVSIKEIPGKKLGDDHVFTISDGTDTYTTTASVTRYAKSIHGKTNDANMKLLAESVYLYYEAAKAYFGN